jgi:spermidine dehydrogenase
MSDYFNNPKRDRELGMDRAITRRDFLNGVAVTVGGVLGSRAFGSGAPAEGAAGKLPRIMTW